MLEVEVKYRCWDHAALQKQLERLGAVAGESLHEEDHYFNAPDRDFAQTDEAIRLRRIGPKNFVTYKGPKADFLSKTRREIEVPLAPGAEAADKFTQLLGQLGYRPVAIVKKNRRIFRLEQANQALEVCLDHVDQVGDFVELEIQATEEQMEQARAVLLATAAKLGLAQSLRRSYLEMLLASGDGTAETEQESTVAAPACRTARLVRDLDEARALLSIARRSSRRIGLVPTMGALHEGHASLIRAAKEETEYVVVTIFVNPTQFGPNEDFARYPRTLEQDLELCNRENVDLVFAPEAGAIYPPDFRTSIEVHGLQEILEGKSRPGHFRGVATVVLKLFDLIAPHNAYFGQKDAQQVRVIEQMVHDLNVPVKVRVCPTVREADGLALSSRNQYLSAQERGDALCICRSLEEVRRRVAAGERDAQALCREMEKQIASTPGVSLDYAVIVDAGTLEPVQRVDRPVLAAVAARVGKTRLIDNIVLEQ
jgi:pantoate--beta-alanine ligase